MQTVAAAHKMLWFFVACACLSAQTVTLHNASPLPFQGWLRTRVQGVPAWAGWDPAGGPQVYAAGPPDDDESLVDIYAVLMAGQVRVVDLQQMTSCIRPTVQLPLDPISAWGGMPMINNTPMQSWLLELQGAHARVKASTLINEWAVSIDIAWYPDQPWMHVLATVTPPIDGSLLHTVPKELHLTWGTATVLQGSVLAKAGAQVDAGTRIHAAKTLVWPSCTPQQKTSATAMATGYVWASP